MENIDFYHSVAYREKQAAIAKKNWRKGVYNSLYKQEKRQCAKPNCRNYFEVKLSDSKKFCSCSCAAKVNNAKRSKITMLPKRELERLYKSGLSMMEISERTGWKYEKIVYWMRKYKISRRTMSEATYAKRNPDGDPFRLKNKLNKNENFLKGIGLGLYWGEGDKSSNNTSVRVGNTDAQLIKKFREFLLKICGVKEERFGYYLTLFNDCEEKKAIKFWTHHLGITKKQLGKVTKIPPQGKGTYKKKSKFGVLTIVVTNKKLKEKIFEMIDKI